MANRAVLEFREVTDRQYMWAPMDLAALDEIKEHPDMVAAQASLSEVFVPYHDPSEPWNHQAYFDLGTYPSSFGGVTSTLEPGNDCPMHATFFDTWVMQSDGSPKERQRVACLYERPSAEPVGTWSCV